MAFRDSAEELKYLQRCMSDLVSVLALPAVWSGQDPRRIVTTLLDALMATLNLGVLYTRVTVETDGEPFEELRTTPHYAMTQTAVTIRKALNERFGDDSRKWPPVARIHLDGQETSIVSMHLGIDGEIGVVLTGSERTDFPTQSERLLLGVVANQITVGLQQARLLMEQKRIAAELDQRVAERTRELAETNQALQLQVELLQHLPVSTWTLKPDGTPDFVNRVWLEFSGQTLDFIRSHPEAWMAAVHPEDRETASKAFVDGVRSGQSFAFETRSLRAQDGTYRWHLQQAVVLRDADGKVLKFVGTTTDIDDQKRAQEELRASEGKLRRVIDTIPTLSWCNLADGPNEFLSKGWHQYTGLSPEEAHGWGWSVTFHPEDLPALMEKWKVLLISGEPGEIEARIRRHDGIYRWFLIRVAPFRDESGAILRWYGTSTDIDDRKRAEDALRRSEARHRVVVETASDAVVSIDESGAIILANPATGRIFGHKPEELIGKPLTVLMPGAMRQLHEAGLKRYLETGERRLNWQGTEVTAQRANGEEFPAEVSFGEMADRQNITGFIRDISEKKRFQTARSNFHRIYSGCLRRRNARARHFIMTISVGCWFWQSMITAGGPSEIEARFRRFDGDYRWFLFRADPLRDESGGVRKWYGTNTDIDDRKQLNKHYSTLRRNSQE